MPATVKVATEASEYQTVMVGGAYLVKGLLQRLGVAEAIDQALTHQPEIEATYGQLAQVLYLLNKSGAAEKADSGTSLARLSMRLKGHRQQRAERVSSL